MLCLTAASQIAIRSNSLETAQAVTQAIKGTFFIMWHCGASSAAKKCFDNQDHGPGGKKSGFARQTTMVNWQAIARNWLDGRNKEDSPLKGAPLGSGLN